MSNGIIAIFFAAGVSAWIYAKLMRSTGGNQRSSIVASGLIGVLLFFIMLFVLDKIPK